MTREVVLDVDAGSDDAVAILLMLALEGRDGVRVVGVTCTHGNTAVHHVTRNVLATLQSIGRSDIPVYRGAESPLIVSEETKNGVCWHGQDGFGDNHFTPSTTQLQQEHAVLALDRLSRTHTDLSLVCLGPLTNIALTLKTFPSFASSVSSVYVMGGNTTAVGNVPDTTAEFNFHADPEAAHIVLSAGWRRPLVLLPWEPCRTVPISLDWRFEELGQVPSPQIHLLNQVEKDLYNNCACYNPCDAFLAAIVLAPNAGRYKTVRLGVELQGRATRGQGVGGKGREVTLVEAVDFERFKDMLWEMARFGLGE